MSGPLISNIFDAAAPCRSTSSICAGSTPARRARVSPSASTTPFSPMTRFVTSFTVEPIPHGPTWNTFRAIVSKRGRAASYADRSPPTVTTQSRRATMALVPLTGASSRAAPPARAACSIRTASSGEMVLIWTMIVSFDAPARIPSAPAIACCSHGNPAT